MAALARCLVRTTVLRSYNVKAGLILSRKFASEAPKTERTMSEISNFEKRILVWTKRYPSLADVPANVPVTTMRTARDRFRWKLAVIAMALTVLGSIGMVISGKRASARGDSMYKRGMAWHEELRPGSTK